MSARRASRSRTSSSISRSQAGCCGGSGVRARRRWRQLRVGRGETLGLVGKSGCGKTTVSRMVLKLLEPTAGRILLGGVDVTQLSPARMWGHRRRVQIVFQDPYSSLNPRLTAGTIVGEPMENFGIAAGKEKDERVARAVRARRPAARRHGANTRTSSPAGSASGSASPRRWRSTPT